MTTLTYPDLGGGYAAIARAALASLVNADASPAARQAFEYVKAQTPRLEAAYAKDPTFAIVPRDPEED